MYPQSFSPWKQIKARVAFQSQYFTVRNDLVRQPDGRRGTYAYMDHGGGVGIVVVAIPLEPMKIVRMPLKKAIKMVLNGRITCSYAITGIIRAAAKLGVVQW